MLARYSTRKHFAPPSITSRKAMPVPDEKPSKDMTMAELLASQVDREPIERAQGTGQTDDEG